MLPEDPTTNIWHFYKCLAVTPNVYRDRLIMLINDVHVFAYGSHLICKTCLAIKL